MIGPKIPPFRPTDEPPPATVIKFFGWGLQGAWPGLMWGTFWSAAAGSLEAVSAVILGLVVDASLTATPASIFTDHWQLFVGFALKLFQANEGGSRVESERMTKQPSGWRIVVCWPPAIWIRRSIRAAWCRASCSGNSRRTAWPITSRWKRWFNRTGRLWSR